MSVSFKNVTRETSYSGTVTLRRAARGFERRLLATTLLTEENDHASHSNSLVVEVCCRARYPAYDRTLNITVVPIVAFHLELSRRLRLP